MNTRNKAVVVFSGGQDSTTCLIQALNTYYEVSCITFNYGQRHNAEVNVARNIFQKLQAQYGVRLKEHLVIDFPLLGELTTNALTKDIPVDTEAPASGTPNTFVDGRNMIFLTLAAVYAKSKGITHIVTGVCQTDFSGYPDCKDVFIKSLNASLNLAMDYNFQIVTPLMWLDKADTWRLAFEYDSSHFVYSETLTCYNGVIGPGCGECPACKLRSEGWSEFNRRYPTMESRGK